MILKDIKENEDFKLTATTTIVNTVVEHIEAINKSVTVKKGTVTATLRDWNITVFQIAEPKYYTSHMMAGYTRFAQDKLGFINRLKTSGYNHCWLYMDVYQDNYPEDVKNFMDAANTATSFPIMIGMSSWMSAQQAVQLFTDTWGHPALHKIGGKRVYSIYEFEPGAANNMIAALAAAGFSRNTYLLWCHCRYPIEETPGVWQEMATSVLGVQNQVEHLYDTWPEVDGLINFAVNKGGSGEGDPMVMNILVENYWLPFVGKARGKLSMAGVNSSYASVQFTRYSFQQLVRMWKNILLSPIDERPTAINDTTANDHEELSNMSVLYNPPVSGISHLPNKDENWLVAGTRPLVLDHSGMQKFCKPFIDAYKKDLPAAVFTADAIFYSYPLHPHNAALVPTIPAELTALNNASNGNKFNQVWWDTTLYATGYKQAAGVNQIEGIKGWWSEKLMMGVHLVTPAQLNINNTLSAVLPAGAAWFEIDMGTFRGNPKFSIWRNGVKIKEVTGLQPITDSVYPGGWDYLSI